MKKELLATLLAKGVSLKVVEGNLKVNAPKGALTKELIEKIKANKAYLISKLTVNVAIPKAAVAEKYISTPTQYFMWFTHEFLGGNRAYNITSTLLLKGELNITVLETSFKKVIQRHESLRTNFKKDGEKIYQHIRKEDEFEFSLETVTLENFTKEAIGKEVKAEYDTSFQLDKDLLIKAKLISGPNNEHILLFVIHHIIGDGWSLQLLTKEVIQLYQSSVNNTELQLPELKIHYKDYSVWLHEKLNSTLFKNKLAYWKNVYATPTTILELSSEKNRPAIKTYEGKLFHYEFPAAFYMLLNTYTKEKQTTLFMLLIGGLNGLFYKYTGETDITLGTTVAGRDHSDLEHQIGLYSNALPIRSEFEATDSFSELITKQKETLLKIYEHKQYPFTELIKQLNLPKDSSRSPLFDIMVLLQNHRTLGLNPEAGIHGVAASEYTEIERGVSQMDATFIFVEAEEKLSLSVEYNTAIFNEEYIKNCIQHLENFLANGIAKTELLIKEIPILTSEEEYKLLSAFNPTNTITKDDFTILELLESIIKKHPNNIALQQGNEAITYQELETLTTKLSEYLLKEYKIELGDFIAIELERSVWTIIAMIAVLKSGGVYVPIDISYPESRKAFIKKDSDCKVVIDENMLATFKNYQHSEPSDKKRPTPNDLAYIIYTSGSTGVPKGVQISHASLADYAVTFQQHFNVTASDKILQQASISFDTSIEEIFPILISGGTLVIHKSNEDFNALLALCETQAITILSTNPFVLGYLNTNYETYDFKFRLLISGGDVVKPSDVNNIYEKVAIYNTYGPTESTVCATYHHIKSIESSIPIGKPIRNRQLYILTPNTLQLTPIGIIGEICISGKGLSQGYLNKEELTAEKFIKHPFNEGELLYRSGDLGKWLPDGTIEFVGRKDNQIKLHGYRIELGEISHALLKLEAITQAEVLIKKKSGEKILIAYIVGNQIEQQHIREELSHYLPKYMLPMHYVTLESFPVTANGKIDKRALLAIDFDVKTSNEYVAPTTTLEKELSKIWSEILAVEKVGITDNFFELGGHSLKAIKLINTIAKELKFEVKIQDIFTNVTIQSLIPSLKKLQHESIPKATKQASYPVTSSQERIWVLSQFEGGNAAYNIVNTIHLVGSLHIEMLEKAIQLVIDKHESLRTSFKSIANGELHQFIAENVSFSIDKYTLTEKSKIENQIASFASHAFNLENAPLLKVGLIKENETSHFLMFNLHHISGDGWSVEILYREVVTFYNTLHANQKNNSLPLQIHYKDYTVWKLDEAHQQQLSASKRYWLDIFKGEIPVLDMPTDFSRPAVKTYNGAQFSYQFSAGFAQKIKAFTKSKEATLFMGLMAGLNGLFYRYSGQTDIILGTPVAGRSHSDLENQIGLYLNTLAIRTNFSKKDTYHTLLQKQKEVLLAGYENEEYPFDTLIDDLSLTRDITRSALFDVMVVLHNQQDVFAKGNELVGLISEAHKSKHRKHSQFDLSFAFSNHEEALSVVIEYNTDIYVEHTILRFIQHLENFIEEGIHHPTTSISKLSFLAEAEQEKIAKNYTEKVYDEASSLVELLENQANKTPNAIAVLYEDTNFTYQEIQEKSNQLAQYLLTTYDLSSNKCIGVQVPRNEWLLISILAILKTGNAYVPIDINYPQVRIEYIISDSACDLIITEELLKTFKKTPLIANQIPEISIEKDGLAYIIYTSGSTGKPKGVQITHQNAIALLNWSKEEYANTPFDILYAVTSHCFDLSVYEFFYPLSIGKQIRVLENGLSIPSYVDKDKNILINTVPSVIEGLLDTKINLENVVAINMAGEPIPIALSNTLVGFDIELRNLYGPSEDTTYSSCYRINKRHQQAIPIGKPITNTRFYILSEELALQPIGVIGEICISGSGVALGYLNREELTKEKFIKNPFENGNRLYRTGDLGRWLPNGEIEFIGRKDDQVKLRGYRIELEEIVYALSTIEKVAKAAVLIKEQQGEKILIAYLVGKEINEQELQKQLTAILPAYMLPNQYVFIEKLPLTPNGKIDKKALHAIEIETKLSNEYVAPTTELEKALSTIWSTILGVEKVGITDNFFALGGHSLKAVKLVNSIVDKGYFITINEIFKQPTITAIIPYLEKKNGITQISKAPNLENYPVTSSQQRIWTLSQFEGGDIAYNITNAIQIDGDFDIGIFKKAITQLITRHESLRTVFKATEDGLRQYILETKDTETIVEVFNTVDETEISSIIQKHATHTFDFTQASLLKIAVITLTSNKHILLFNLHHIIGDGWSLEILSRELVANYNNLKLGEVQKQKPLPIQYKDYAYWLTTTQHNVFEISKKYWHNQLSGELPVIEIPVAKPRPKVKTYNGGLVTHTFKSTFLKALKAKVQEQKTTLFIGLLAGINGLLYRYTGLTDIILGTPVAGREQSVLENQIGLYLNTLAIRTQFEKTDSFDTLLQKQKEIVLAGHTHQSYPFDLLVNELSLKRDTSRSALFDIMVILHNQQDVFEKGENFVNTIVSPYKASKEHTSQFDISFSFTEKNDELVLSCSHNTAIYSEEVIKKCIMHLENFILDAIQHKDKMVSEIEYVSKQEQAQLLAKNYSEAHNDKAEQSIVAYIQKQCVKTPEAIAIRFEDKEFTYQTVHELSNQLAHYMINTHGISLGDKVAVKLERTEWLFISILAVLKTGAAYVPIDVNYPEDRITYMENDSACTLSITQELLDAFQKEVNSLPTASPQIEIHSDSLAYLIYTSGSTGQPKGVMITHANATAFLHWCQKEFKTTNFEIAYAVTSHCFDLSVYELFFPLSIGKQIRILPNGLSIPEYITNDDQILINTVPSVIENLVERKISFNTVAAINMAGEPLPIALSNSLIDHNIELRNLYGPSEDTTYSSCYKITKKHEHTLPIGKPIDGTQFYILSSGMSLQSEGIVGEICISGKGLAKGYFNKQDLTDEKFVENPFDSNSKLYRTGDLGYWMPDGNIGFVGRKDHQVKLRGYRIELSEIEHVLQTEANIQQAVVLIKEISAEKYITAYLVGNAIDFNHIRNQLAKKLPNYMIPSHFLNLAKIPLTPNGKIDKKALLQLEVSKIKSSQYVAAKTAVEETLVAAWEEMLKTAPIGVLDNFFELGGHSLIATELLSTIAKEFDVQIKLEELFLQPTIQNLAISIENAKWAKEVAHSDSAKKIII